MIYANGGKAFSSAGGFDDTPYSRFVKADGQNVEITQNLSSNAVLSTQSNFSTGDDGYPISASNFDLTKISVLALGSLDVSVDRITDLSESITGNTDSLSKIEYSDSEQSASGEANASGSFALSVTKKPIVGDVATVKSNKNFLTTSKKVTVYGSVSVLNGMSGNAFAVPKGTATVKRINPDWKLQLTDTRVNGGKWELYLSLKSPLQSSSVIVNDAVAFMDGNVQILESTPISVASGTTDKAGTIDVTWSENNGVILVLDDEKEYEKGDYSSTLEWGVDFE